MTTRHIKLLFLLFLAPWTARGAGADLPGTVSYRGVDYVSLDYLGKLIDGVRDVTPQARALPVMVGGKRWEFINGGHRLKGPEGQEQLLDHPVLVIGGRHFVPVDECASPFGYQRSAEDPLRLTHGTRSLPLEPRAIDSRYRRFRISRLKPVHESLVTTKKVRLLRSLHSKADQELIHARTPLVVRRRLVINGQPYALVTVPSTLRSYLAPDSALKGRTRRLASEDPTWARHRAWFDREAATGTSLSCGYPATLERKAVLTIDFCWSLHAMEEALLEDLVRLAKARPRGVRPVLLLSGRWIDQHPVDMERLIEMQVRDRRIGFIWGNHSWAHPKSYPFMNSYSTGTLRDDTLRVERTMLEWGVAPSVYYRFPGLVHDATHLREILALDLFPIDSDAWMALIGQKNPNDPAATLEFHLPRAGSIALVHGNGNETQGIPVLSQWLAQHGDWDLVSPAELFAAGLLSEKECALPPKGE